MIPHCGHAFRGENRVLASCSAQAKLHFPREACKSPGPVRRCRKAGVAVLWISGQGHARGMYVCARKNTLNKFLAASGPLGALSFQALFLRAGSREFRLGGLDFSQGSPFQNSQFFLPQLLLGRVTVP